MSKIALSGPASGTATYTISAPTGATDRTITLPDQTATLITNSSGVLDIGSGQLYKDASGNVGIGISAPTARLHVSSATTGSVIVGKWTDSATDTGYLTTVSGGGCGVGAGGFLALGSGGGAAFTERGRFDTSGKWLFNCTGQTGDAPNTAGGRINETNGNEKVRVAADTQVAFQFYSPSGGTGSPVGVITVNASSTSYVTSSDYRLKENIAPMTGALSRVAALNPVTYTWKNTGEADEGFIAHELQEVCPSAVTGEKDAVDAEGNPQYQGIDTSFLVATLTAAIQELKAIVDAQATRIAALEGTQP